MSRFTLIFILVLMTGSSARGQFAGGGFDGSSFNALYTETFGQFNGGVKDGATLFAMLSSHPGIFHGGTESGFHSALYDSESNIGFNGGLGRGSITSTYLTDQLSPMTKGGTSDGSDQLIIRTLIWTGDISTNWNDPDNWNRHLLPTKFDIAFIGNGKPNYPLLDGGYFCIGNISCPEGVNYTARSVGIALFGRIDGSGSLQIGNAGEFDIRGTLDLTDLSAPPALRNIDGGVIKLGPEAEVTLHRVD